jgi:hypothetical protein
MLVVVAMGLACSFDPSSSGGNVDIGSPDASTETTSSTASAATTSGDATTKLGTTTPDDTTGDAISSDSASDDPSVGSSETGPPAPQLVDRGLVARWFLAESAAGAMPTVTADAAEEPFDLSIDFTSANLRWTEENGQRGLRWLAAGGNGGPIRAVADSKFTMLHGRTSVTIEIVAAIDGVTSNDSRLFHVGTGSDPGDLTVRSGAIDSVELVVNGSDVADWNLNLPLLGRAVLHLVYDSSVPVEEDRARLYIDGMYVVPSSSSPPEMNEPIELSKVPYVSLGNRDADRSIQGAIFYAALYARTLADDEIMHNATLLFADDDP